jgi:hypothetical protein
MQQKWTTTKNKNLWNKNKTYGLELKQVENAKYIPKVHAVLWAETQSVQRVTPG